MADTEREDVGDALRDAVDLIGTGLLDDPGRLRAVLADLVGTVGRDHRAEVRAVVAAAESLSSGATTEAEAVAATSSVAGSDAGLAPWAVLSVAEQRGDDLTYRHERSPRHSIGAFAIASAALVLGAIALTIVVTSGGDDGATTSATSANPSTDPAATTATTATTETANTTATTLTTGFVVDFAEANEDGFGVDRTWVVQNGELRGDVTLTGLDGVAVTSIHRELVPADAIASTPVFEPEPVRSAEQAAGTIASLLPQIGPGEQFSFSFSAPLTSPAPDQATVQSWLATWRAEWPAQIFPTEDVQAADASIAAIE